MKLIQKLKIAIREWFTGMSWADAWGYAKAIVDGWRKTG